VITEAGFGADLGAEKFFDIKCRQAGLSPDAVVLVATVRALKMHGGVGKEALTEENVQAVKDGCVNLARHIENIRGFGLPVVVAINQFSADTEAEVQAVKEVCEGYGVRAIGANHWAEGGNGTTELAAVVAEMADSGEADFTLTYPDELPLWEKIEAVATKIYRADGVTADAKTRNQVADLQAGGFGELPICIAKTQYSFSTDPTRKGAPTDHTLSVREVRLSAGAGFVVVVCGDVMTMPGLPRVPAANRIRINDQGEVEGLF
jgi:formate--tetrahydrofolate ligase